MLGKHYFAVRVRLSDLMHGVLDLADEVNADLTDHLPTAEINDLLGPPFLFVISGEVNAGKSSLINALFAKDLCRVNILPETSRVYWYCYGNPPRDEEITNLLERRFRPIDFLRDFNLIDTPGTNSVVQSHQGITERFLPTADLILFVFPVTNPWGAATWDFVSTLSPELLDKVVFIIQQADQRELIDIEVILGHMADLSQKRLGRVPPIFPVSGMQAFHAKRAVPFCGDLYQRSGYQAFEDFISKSVCESPRRKKMLDDWRYRVSCALRKVEDRIEDQTRALNVQRRFLESTEQEIDAMREGFVSRLSNHLTGVAEVFEREGEWVSKLLRKKLTIIPSWFRLFTMDKTSQEMETIFIERLQAAVEAVAEKDGDQVVAECREHWPVLLGELQKTMPIDLDGEDKLRSLLEASRAHFIQRLGRAARMGIGNLKVRNRLAKDLSRRNLTLKSFTVLTLLLIIVGASCGAMGVSWLPAIFCSLAGLALIMGMIMAWITANQITAEFRDFMLGICGTYAAALRVDYEDGLRMFFQEYSGMLSPVRNYLVREKMAVEPRLRRWQDLFVSLKAIEQDI